VFFIGWNRSHGFFENLAMFFLGIGVVYCAIYFGGKQSIELKSNEAGLKYFNGVFASGLYCLVFV
jgi:hypothetical protein